ncbi:polymorphic toxin-type HINT domain-containing protein [Streptomyces sp. NPDC048577]|uniref:polymorphic toxin-type HINT domain-containing protein n=1 Tax=Streptomyces sp. NPDC048577 TaxID=3157209 RepID=UPI0034161788
MPVFGNHSGEPCHQTSYAGSSCTQAWRWNLDHVEDVHGNAMIIDWKQETNEYARNGEFKKAVSYVRGGYPTQVLYGLRGDNLTGAPAGKVVFTAKERCVVEGATSCSVAEFESKDYEDKQPWWDTPATLHCKTGAENCYITSPTFWTRVRLASVSTYGQRTPGSTALSPVDRWDLHQSFPRQRTDTHPPLWLESVRRTGYSVPGANGAQTSTTLPDLSFIANVDDMPNRVAKSASDPTPEFDRLRVETVRTETGGEVYVDYSAPCPKGTAHPAPETNTGRCFPSKWSPDPDLENPPLEWFNKYVVDRIVEKDRVARQPDVVTTYVYDTAKGAAWAKNTDEFTKPELRTYDQWRGYDKVTVKRGVTSHADPDTATERSQTVTRYFRGMSRDAGRAVVTVKDSTGEETLGEDLPAYQGRTAETISSTKDGGSLVARETSRPFARKTATRARGDGLPALEAYSTGTDRTDAEESISGGKSRTARSETLRRDAYDLPLETQSYTLTETEGGALTKADESCAVTSYVHNVTKHLIGLPQRVRTTVGDCQDAASATGDQVIFDARTSYDALNAFGAAPVKGLPRQVDTIDGDGDGWITSARTEYDALGRAVKSVNAQGASTANAFSPATGVPFQATTTNALNHTATSTVDPGRGSVLSLTDPNGRTTTSHYDDLGRVTDVWTPSRDSSTDKASVHFDYQIDADKVPAVTMRALRDNGTYADSVTIYDGLLRPRQTQTEALGGGRVVSDTLYNANGLVGETRNSYFTKDEPKPEIFVPETVFEAPNSTKVAYDGLGRAVRTTTLHDGDAQHSSTAVYAGDWTLTRTGMSADGTTPLKGSRAAKTWTDALGRTAKIEHYTTTGLIGPDPASDDTRYAYDPRGKLARVTDADGNTWTYTYDVRGRLTASADPDMGPAGFGYDDLDQQTWSRDGRDRAQYTLYDVLGRPTELHDDSETGPLVSKWTYDTLPGAKGYPVASTRYNGGAAFTSEVTGYDTEYRPTGSKITIPATPGTTGLAGTYAYTNTYTETGKLQSVTLPATPGGLAAEKVITRYNGEGAPITTSGLAWYTSGTLYNPFGQVLRTTSGEGSKRLWTTAAYDEATGRLKETVAQRETTSPVWKSTTAYGYDTVGNVTSITGTQSETSGTQTTNQVDRQCFAYDPMGRLVHAWTGSDTCPTATSAQGAGPAEGGLSTGVDGSGYWQSYEFDAIGNRTKLTVHDPAGVKPTDEYEYSYGRGDTNNGSQPTTTAQPHTLTDVKSRQVIGGSTFSLRQSYLYDPSGNTTERITAGGETSTFTWDRRNKLTSADTDNDGAANVTYLYDAAGNRLIEDDGTKRTLYLGEAEISVNTAGQALDAKRYYGHTGAPTTVRSTGGKATGHKLTVLLSDHHNTSTMAVDQSGNQAVTRRFFDPYGNPRGTEPTDWPGRHTFLGTGVGDPTTGLTHIGAREYDATTGRFLSADPIIDITDPLQMNGYTYANGNPVTYSDPTGLEIGSTPGTCSYDIKYCTPNQVSGEDPNNGSRDNSPGSCYHTHACGNKGGNGVDSDGTASVNDLGDGKAPLLPEEVAKEWLRRGYPSETQLRNTNGAYYDVLSYELNLELYYREQCTFGGMNDPCGEIRKFYDGWKHVSRIGTVDTCPICSNPGFPIVLAMAGVGNCKCFLAGTDVLMADGSTKDIDKIEVGDEVRAADPETGESGIRKVTRRIVTEDDKLFNELVISTPAGEEKLTATHEHPFWSPSEHRWVPAGQLVKGITLLTDQGKTVMVDGNTAFTKKARTFNLTVDDLHTYYVLAGQTPVLVHNSNCPNGKLSDPLPRGMNNKIASAYDDVKAGRIPSHDTYGGREHPWWAGSKEYRVPGRPETDRILEKELPNGVKVYGWTSTHYTKIQRFSAPHFPDSGWN